MNVNLQTSHSIYIIETVKKIIIFYLNTNQNQHF